MGNSEVGHLTLGCGAIMRQDLVRIDDAISDGTFYDNRRLLDAVSSAKRRGRPLHLAGLVSDGGVHSHLRHLYALLELCKGHGVRPLLHMISDGRDTAPQAAIDYIAPLERALASCNGAIATLCGRYYAMDRDKRWERIQLAWNAMVNNEGRHATSLHDAIKSAYERGETDEFIKPVIFADALPIEAGDAVLFFNFRKDRTRQLTAALSSAGFGEFDRGRFSPVTVTCMTNYDKEFNLPYAFAEEQPETTLAETIYRAGLSQFHCAETEKYAHVTYFFNGGKGDAFPLEERVIIPSPKVNTYDEKPEMSAREVADTVIGALREKYAFVVVNFANGDMVGHTAIREAVIKAVEALDHEVGRVLDAAVAEGYSVILTADHGNCELLVDPETGEPHTQHTTNPVPCMIIDQIAWNLARGGGLQDIAPTILQLMGLPCPGAMTGRSLLITPAESEAAA